MDVGRNANSLKPPSCVSSSWALSPLGADEGHLVKCYFRNKNAHNESGKQKDSVWNRVERITDARLQAAGSLCCVITQKVWHTCVRISLHRPMRRSIQFYLIVHYKTNYTPDWTWRINAQSHNCFGLPSICHSFKVYLLITNTLERGGFPNLDIVDVGVQITPGWSLSSAL